MTFNFFNWRTKSRKVCKLRAQRAKERDRESGRESLKELKIEYIRERECVSMWVGHWLGRWLCAYVSVCGCACEQCVFSYLHLSEDVCVGVCLFE